MRWLIDGYNVMHAGGRLGSKLTTMAGREQFRRARRRFLDDLAVDLGSEGPLDATVVFDATMPPGDFPVRSTYRGIRLIFALEDENADARIELLIADDPNPRSLTVVSSDRRIRQAAARRKCPSMPAEAFWEHLDAARERAKRQRRQESQARAAGSPATGQVTAPADESAFWVRTFGDVLDEPEIEQLLAANPTLLTDAEIAEIEREIADEP